MPWQSKESPVEIAAQCNIPVLQAISANTSLSFLDPTVQDLSHPTVQAIITTNWHLLRMHENWITQTANDDTNWPPIPAPPNKAPAPRPGPAPAPAAPPTPATMTAPAA